MITYVRAIVVGLVASAGVFISVSAQSQSETKPSEKKYDLAIPHTKERQFFYSETKLQKLDFNGNRPAPDIFRLWLQCDPTDSGDKYTCISFTIQSGTNPEISIPQLSNWSYVFKLSATDEKGQVLGIDHAPFEKLVDAKNNVVPVDKAYHVYNAFIDFHSMNVFADKSPSGKGIQDLHYVGDKIVHYAAFSQPPVNLGANIKEGSVFKNGQITLFLKGIGAVNNVSTAIIEYDSGESSFKMIFSPMPSMDVTTTGSSHYWGDIYKSLRSGWIQRAVLHEFVVSETVIPGQANKVPTAIERTIEIRNTTPLKK